VQYGDNRGKNTKQRGIQSIPEPFVGDPLFHVPDGCVNRRNENAMNAARLIEHDVKERIVATQNSFDVSASVHFEREGLLHVGSELWPTFAHVE
jgi:hypothetical protein